MIGEETQKHENKSAQEIITEIKRENKETSEAIVKTFEKVTLQSRSSNIFRSKSDSTIDQAAYNSQTLLKKGMIVLGEWVGVGCLIIGGVK